jgi:dihydrofolate reductase
MVAVDSLAREAAALRRKVLERLQQNLTFGVRHTLRGHGRMKTQFYTASSLDGFIATEDDSLEWLFPLGDLNASSYPQFIAQVGALAMGSATYEWIVRHAETVAAEAGSPWPYTQPTWVFTSRQLPIVPGADVRFVSGRVSDVFEAMRAAAGDRSIWVVGGGDLAGQFYDAGFLDEIIVQIGSVTLGRGKALFPRRLLSPQLRLVSVQQMGTGMAELRYEVARPSVRGDA